MVIDKNLNRKAHIDYISAKISKACGDLSKLRHCLSSKLLIEIYYALIHSYLRYGIITWGNASTSVLKPLQTVINRAVRIITFAPFGHVDMQSIFKELEILDVKNTHFLETSKYMFKLKNDLLPMRFANYFENDNHSTGTTNTYTLRNTVRTTSIKTRLASSDNSIQIRGEKLWNEIPEIIKYDTSLPVFKRLVKCMLLEKLD